MRLCTNVTERVLVCIQLSLPYLKLGRLYWDGVTVMRDTTLVNNDGFRHLHGWQMPKTHAGVTMARSIECVWPLMLWFEISRPAPWVKYR